MARLIIKENDYIKLNARAIIVSLRNKKGSVIYSSGLHFFYHRDSELAFIEMALRVNPQLEIYYYDGRHYVPPSENTKKGYWCPYCQSWEYWKANELGYKCCPHCGIGEADFYVRSYNHTWDGMGNKKQKIVNDKIKERIGKK